MTLRLAARGSALSLAQSELVANSLRARGHEVAIAPYRTTGDRLSSEGRPISGKGIFTREIDEAVLSGQADFGVHSAKDLPSEIASGLVIAAVPVRADPRDVLIARAAAGLAGLPQAARVGTGSPRRKAQLLAARPDLRIEEARGNVDTRLRRLAEGRFDAIVLAAAGLARLGRLAEATEILAIETMIPAIGQGALALVARRGDEAVIRTLRSLEDPGARATLEAERALLGRLEAGCRAPMAGHARVEGTEMRLTAGVFSTDGTRVLVASAAGPASDGTRLGEEAARDLLSRGAADLLAEARA